MPELPEVQTIINKLNNSKAINNRIIGVDIFTSKILKNISKQKFVKMIVGLYITKFDRKGKYILVFLSNKYILAIHLRMEGKLFYEKEINNAKHLRIKLKLKNGYLNFYDSRMFGTFHLYKNIKELENSKEFKKVGNDIFENKITPTFLINKFKNKNQAIKTTLLDQSIISGIGNIYADEILFDSKISPFRKTKDIKLNEIKNILTSTKKILTLAIKYGGSSVSSFKSDAHSEGKYQKYLKVYGKKNKKCPRCGGVIKFSKLNGRGTSYCPKCQK
jgi:formamidopyrimidine-DNA glycosylase